MIAKSRKQAEKQYQNLMNIYTVKAKGKYEVRMLAMEFAYQYVDEDE